MRKSLTTQEQELRDGRREVELKKKFLMERETKLDQKEVELDQRSTALDQSRSQLLKYEAEMQASAAQLQEKAVPKASSCRSWTWRTFQCLLRLIMCANLMCNVANLIFWNDKSTNLQPATSDKGLADLDTFVV